MVILKPLVLKYYDRIFNTILLNVCISLQWFTEERVSFIPVQQQEQQHNNNNNDYNNTTMTTTTTMSIDDDDYKNIFIFITEKQITKSIKDLYT